MTTPALHSLVDSSDPAAPFPPPHSPSRSGTTVRLTRGPRGHPRAFDGSEVSPWDDPPAPFFLRLALLACVLRRRICSRLLARGGAPLGFRVGGGKEGGRHSLLLVFDRLVVAQPDLRGHFFRRRPRGFPSPARILGTLFPSFQRGDLSVHDFSPLAPVMGFFFSVAFRVPFSLAWSFARFFSGARLPPAAPFDCAPAESTSSRTQRLRVPTTAFVSRVRPRLLSPSRVGCFGSVGRGVPLRRGRDSTSLERGRGLGLRVAVTVRRRGDCLVLVREVGTRVARSAGLTGMGLVPLSLSFFQPCASKADRHR